MSDQLGDAYGQTMKALLDDAGARGAFKYLLFLVVPHGGRMGVQVLTSMDRDEMLSAMKTVIQKLGVVIEEAP